WRRVLVALIPFVLISGSLAGGFFLTGQGVTLGESGKLNYAWNVNGLPFVNWQGESPGSGRPVHPTRKIFPSPPVYEFAAPIGGTYPPWYDPAYWYEGVKLRVDPNAHLANLVRSAGLLLGMLLRAQGSLLINGLLLLYVGRRGWLFLLDVRPCGVLLIPPIAAVGIFSLIWLELRYIGAFVALFWLGLFSALTFVESPEIQRVIKGITVAMLAMLLMAVSFTSYEEVLKGLLARQHSFPQWTVAQGIQQFGLHPGDGVGVILPPPGPVGAYWARLSRVRIIAEIPACRAYAGSLCPRGEPDGVSAFLQADQETQARI